MEGSPSNALKILMLIESMNNPEADSIMLPQTPALYVESSSLRAPGYYSGEVDLPPSLKELKTQLEDLVYLKVPNYLFTWT